MGPGGPVVGGAKAKIVYKDASDQDFTDDGEIDDAADSDFDAGAKAPAKKRSPKKTPAKKSPAKKGKKKTPAKKTPAKETPAKKGRKAATNGTTPRASGRASAKIKYNEEDEDDDEEEEDEEDFEDEVPLKARKVAKQAKGRATAKEKIWAVYWALGGATSLPSSWPAELSTSYNADTPLTLPSLPEVFLSSSPPPFCPSGREVDIAAIIKAINNAEKFVEIAVMDYIPATLYTHPMEFWPDIDDALRRAAINRGVRVRLLTSHWAHTRPAIARFLRSLADLSGSYPKVDIEVKVFTVPSFTPDQEKIPFARVNHNKYMVTDKQGYIGTSNWSGDYFSSTGGVGFVFTGEMRKELASIFERDWTSSYAAPLPPPKKVQELEAESTIYKWL